jgi:hypothetical protein
MAPFQVWLVHWLSTASPAVAAFMRTHWGWPFAETVHFMGLCLLLSAVVVFDLRLLGVAPRIPIAALHKLIPFGLIGFAMNVVTGSMFLLTEPSEYIFNPSFHFKVLFLMVAGANALLFYLIAWRRIEAGAPPPRSARIIAVISLSMWFGVIVAGRLLTFYRPGPCGDTGPGVLAACDPRRR